jgi:hypothetical protein
MKTRRLLAGFVSLLFLSGVILTWMEEIVGKEIAFNDSMRFVCASVAASVFFGIYAVRGRFLK